MANRCGRAREGAGDFGRGVSGRYVLRPRCGGRYVPTLRFTAPGRASGGALPRAASAQEPGWSGCRRRRPAGRGGDAGAAMRLGRYRAAPGTPTPSSRPGWSRRLGLVSPRAPCQRPVPQVTCGGCAPEGKGCGIWRVPPTLRKRATRGPCRGHVQRALRRGRGAGTRSAGAPLAPPGPGRPSGRARAPAAGACGERAPWRSAGQSSSALTARAIPAGSRP